MSEAKKQPGMATLVIVLACICLVSAAVLGLVNKVTVGPIQANTEKTVQESLRNVMPIDGDYEDVTDQYSGDPVTVDVTGSVVPVKAVYKAGDEGYVVESMSPNGFGGALDMMAGVDNDGNDVTSDVSYMVLDAHAHTRIPNPWMGVRLHEGSPREFKTKVFNVIRIGTGEPKIFNDAPIIRSMLGYGKPLEEARGYVGIGCV